MLSKIIIIIPIYGTISKFDGNEFALRVRGEGTPGIVSGDKVPKSSTQNQPYGFASDAADTCRRGGGTKKKRKKKIKNSDVRTKGLLNDIYIYDALRPRARAGCCSSDERRHGSYILARVIIIITPTTTTTMWRRVQLISRGTASRVTVLVNFRVRKK